MISSLLNNESLESSSTVANSLMNRERNCVGGNSYSRELSFNPIEWLKSRLSSQPQVKWLDLCCGTGKALIEAAQILSTECNTKNLQITGIDLVGMFDQIPQNLDILKLKETAFSRFRPLTVYDLITCVHGLHYIGDKIGLIQEAISWLKEDGIFIANLGVDNLRSCLKLNVVDYQPTNLGKF